MPDHATCDNCNGRIDRGGGYSFYSSASVGLPGMKLPTGSMLLCESCTAGVLSAESWNGSPPIQAEFSAGDVAGAAAAVFGSTRRFTSYSIVQNCKAHGFTPEAAKTKAGELAKRFWEDPKAAENDAVRFWTSPPPAAAVQVLPGGEVLLRVCLALLGLGGFGVLVGLMSLFSGGGKEVEGRYVLWIGFLILILGLFTWLGLWLYERRWLRRNRGEPGTDPGAAADSGGT